jgi:O-antigen/teichoic acid export membrane protein
MKAYRSFAKNIGLMGFTQVVLGLQALLLLPLLTKFLGLTYYGIWSQIKITIILLSTFAMFGFEFSIIRFMSGKKNTKVAFSSILAICIISSVLLATIVYLFSTQIGLFLTQVPSAGAFFKFSAILILFNTLHTLFITFFRAKENIRLFSLVEVIRTIFELGLIYFFLLNGYGLISVIFSFIVIKFALILFEFFALREYLTRKLSLKLVKVHLNYSLPLMIAPILYWVLQTSDQYIIGYFLGVKAISVYALVYGLSYCVKFLSVVVRSVLQPALSRAVNQGDLSLARSYFEYSYKYIFMMIIPFVFGLSFLSELIIKIVSTTEFLEGVTLIPIIATGIGVSTFFGLASQLLLLNKETKRLRNILISLAFLNICLNFLLVPTHGMFGAAISTFLTFLISAIFGIHVLKTMKVNLMPKFLLKSILSASIMSLLVVLMNTLQFSSLLLKFVSIIFVAVPIYFISLYLLRGIKRKEVVFLIKSFNLF